MLVRPASSPASRLRSSLGGAATAPAAGGFYPSPAASPAPTLLVQLPDKAAVEGHDLVKCPC